MFTDFAKKDLEIVQNLAKFHYINNNTSDLTSYHSPTVDPLDIAEILIVGFINILEGCRNFKVEHLIYASSSSVYGGNKIYHYNEKQSVDHPVSLYAATKKSNEVIAHSYSHLFEIPSTGLRFFTVY